jgi:S-DNA-T family DNA segregation ATPase FtsK/SpoIIIE
MKVLGPTPYPRLNEAAAVVLLLAALFLLFSLVSYHPLDPSWNTAAGHAAAVNLTGRFGALLADLLLQGFGLAAYLVPALLAMLGWHWLRSNPIPAGAVRLAGAALLVVSLAAGASLVPGWRPIAGLLPAGGLLGHLLAEELLEQFNPLGAVLVTLGALVISLYLVSSFRMSVLTPLLRRPAAACQAIAARYERWRAARVAAAKEKAAARVARRAATAAEAGPEAGKPLRKAKAAKDDPPIVDPLAAHAPDRHAAPFEETSAAPPLDEIPIRALEPPPAPPPLAALAAAAGAAAGAAAAAPRSRAADRKGKTPFHQPATDLLSEPAERSPYDSAELKEIAGRIKAKFEEFNVRGNVVQINPGPVVTTFEFKPEAGVKYSRITTLSEDLCLGLQAESILIERIPGKPTVGIEVPNSKREVISLRQILESEEFTGSASPLTIALGKDISGRIKVAALDAMPHLLIAGSTGSGKSVMLNTLIMSVLFKANPHQVRMIMVDPKRLEFGLYEGIPHLLTPVITDPKKATYALKNAVLEMERRLKLLASQGVRNIEQFNRKVRALKEQPRSLFEDDPEPEQLEPLPYVLIVIDELADLMMLERQGVEESVTRLAQMARAVGMHLVLATQRPSVDVITGLIKANFPSRISFRVATRVDSRTVLDVMGAEHLLGKGDMLFLPPGSSRLVRVHGAYVTENETNRVVEFWKQQAQPDYDQSFLLAPPSEDAEDAAEEFEGAEDPLYQDAVRVVCEIGKASTSTLQRRLRLGYGRAARILDMMQRDGIIGPPDGSRPRDVLKRPDWLSEVEDQLR